MEYILMFLQVRLGLTPHFLLTTVTFHTNTQNIFPMRWQKMSASFTHLFLDLFLLIFLLSNVIYHFMCTFEQAIVYRSCWQLRAYNQEAFFDHFSSCLVSLSCCFATRCACQRRSAHRGRLTLFGQK